MLHDDEAQKLRTQILDEVGELLFEHLAGAEWGRLLVETLATDDGDLAVVSIEAAEITGDEARVDAAFDGERGREMLPVLAQATSALSALSHADASKTGGGTFLRTASGAFAFLPGRVPAPSPWFERHRDHALADLRERHAALPFALPLATRVDVDAEEGRVRLFRVSGGELGAADGLVLGAFSRLSRAWSWAWAIPSLPDAAKANAKAMIDALVDRDGWELTTPQFGSDEPTATALCAIICELSEAAGLVRVPQSEGSVYISLRNPQGTAGGTAPQ